MDNLNSDMQGAIKNIESGDIADITKSGVYYVYNTVTNKPYGTGGLYVLAYQSADNVVGLYIPNNTNTDIMPATTINNGVISHLMTDVYMSTWTQGTYTQGSDVPTSDFSCAFYVNEALQLMFVNIGFTISSSFSKSNAWYVLATLSKSAKYGYNQRVSDLNGNVINISINTDGTVQLYIGSANANQRYFISGLFPIS